MQLSVFSYTFDEKDAAVMLECGVEKATVLLRILRDHGLLLFNSQNSQHYLHMAVKQYAMAQAAAMPTGCFVTTSGLSFTCSATWLSGRQCSSLQHTWSP